LDKSITYVGLDVHKDTIAVALAEAGAHKDVREYGKIANTATALNALAAKLSRAGSELQFCYEAGPCGYGIQRQLTLAGHGCVVVAPSLIPRKPGDRIKTDRRDAINLAKLHRAGELTAVWIPDQAHEAIRDLVRASCGRPQSAPGPSAALWLSPTSWPSLQSAGVDVDAPSLDGRPEI
jgi:transposase